MKRKTTRERSSKGLRKSPTGIRGLDEITCGGLPAGRPTLVCGGTGCGKTAILNRAADIGVQTIDLEELARHRGSLFGAIDGQSQPSQKWFESCLLDRLDRLDPSRPVLIEAESSKVGDRTIPPALWRAMLRAPRIELAAPAPARAAFLVRSYAGIIGNRPALDAALTRLEVYPGRKRLENWRLLADAGDFIGLAQEVIELHYDPSYARSRRRDERAGLGAIVLETLDENEQIGAAHEVAELMRTKLEKL